MVKAPGPQKPGMSNRARDEGGRFAEELSDQEILKLFDVTNEAFLTAPEIAEEFEVTRQAVTYRLKRMHEDGLVERKEAGASSVGWWAKRAPRLSDEARERADAADPDDAISQAEMKRRLGMDG